MRDTHLTRRQVMRIGAGAVAGAALSARAAGDRPNPGSKAALYKKAVMWDMIKAGKTVREKFEVIKEAGFDGVEMNSPGGPPNDDIKRACEDTGILIEGMVDSFHWRMTWVRSRSTNPRGRRQGPGNCSPRLQRLGGTSVLLVPEKASSNLREISYDQCYQRSRRKSARPSRSRKSWE